MNQFGDFLKKSRINAGLTQEQFAEKMSVSLTSVQKWENGTSQMRNDKLGDLAYYLNIPTDIIIKEMTHSINKNRSNNFPSFLFDEQVNTIISTLHLNLKQQELFGLLCIYQEDFLHDNYYDTMIDLRQIPYQFICDVGSIHLMNIADGLKHVLKYVKKDFLLKVIRLDPESEFDILRMPKPLICEYIDSVYRIPDDFDDADPEEILSFRINMNKAKEILPKISQNGYFYLTDRLPKDPRIKDMILIKDLPNEFFNSYCGIRPEDVSQLICGLEMVTSLEIDDTQRVLWKINQKGRELCKWFSER
ncbi:MAG: helix-turn-helix transcriptional regulator [Oscillospiraceae bacterium]|nr:helix-turn-helix transcriptional regulator [Oscillospiraceae bacterium]